MKLYVVPFLVLLSSGVMAQPFNALKLDDTQISAFGIETQQVLPVQQAISQTFPAKVSVPNAQLRVVSAPLDGVVEALLVAEGETVRQDQPLARIRSSALLELQASYLESLSRRLLSGEAASRDRKLRAEGIVAERRLLESQAAHRENLNAEERDRQALRLAGMPEEAIEQLARTQKLSAVLDVKAPLAGVVLEQIATAGQRLATADPLYRVGDLNVLWVEVHVPLEKLGNIREGSTVDLPQANIHAEVITVGRMVHGTDQGVLVRAQVREGAEQLRPGQFVEARLHMGTDNDALRIPSAAVVRSGDNELVFVRDVQGFVPVPVSVIASEGANAVIHADLPRDAQVVVSGTAALKAAMAGGVE